MQAVKGRKPTDPELRILFWNGPYLPRIGGVEIFTARLGAALSRRGHSVMVAADCEKDAAEEDEIPSGVQVRRLPFRSAMSSSDQSPLAKVRRIAELTTASIDLKRSFRPDVVHLNLTDASAFFHMRSYEAAPTPSVLTFQAAFERDFAASSVTGRIISCADSLVAVSNAAARNVVRFTDTKLDDIEVIHPGVPGSAFAQTEPAPGREASRTLVFLGRLVEEKGLQVLLHALGRIPDVSLRVIGDGVARGALEALAASLGLTERVTFLGQISDQERGEELRRCCAVAVPSLHEELFGMVAVEGGLSGLPVVASRVGGLQEIVVDGETGYLVEPGDDEGFSSAIEKLVRSPSASAKMGRAAKLRCLQDYELGTTVSRYEALYAKAVGRRQGQDVHVQAT